MGRTLKYPRLSCGSKHNAKISQALGVLLTCIKEDTVNFDPFLGLAI